MEGYDPSLYEVAESIAGTGHSGGIGAVSVLLMPPQLGGLFHCDTDHSANERHSVTLRLPC
jgi:hypothetical protein